MITVIQKNYTAPSLNQKEILRYLGCVALNDETQKLIDEALSQFSTEAVYKVCYARLPVNISGNCCDFGVFSVSSSDLTKNLNGCKYVVVFSATIGLGADRLINKYSKISPSKAVMFDAIGSERIEALCNCFCDELRREFGVLKPRFSAGYGDLPIETQSKIFSLLECGKRIGLTLNDSYMMSPSKSVTAFVGIEDFYEL